jgi:serine/threonine protein kinase
MLKVIIAHVEFSSSQTHRFRFLCSISQHRKFTNNYGRHTLLDVTRSNPKVNSVAFSRRIVELRSRTCFIFRLKYDLKVDIWVSLVVDQQRFCTLHFSLMIQSLGILLIEMIDGSPPYINEQPFRAMCKIAMQDEPPSITPESQARVSQNVMSFLQRCLTIDPQQRADTSELLQHVFISHAKPLTSLCANIRAVCQADTD